MSSTATILARGAIGSRPAAGSPGHVYFSTEPKTYRDNGSSWDDVSDTATGASGALIFLEAHTAASSSLLDFTSFISSTYDVYKIEGSELVMATNAVDLRVEIGTGGGPTYDTGNNYEWVLGGNTTGNSGLPLVDNGFTGIARVFKSITNTAGYGFGSFSLTATGLQSTALRKTIQGTLQYITATPDSVFGTWGMQWTTTGTAATALRFIPSSGNITSGTIRIYGVSKS